MAGFVIILLITVAVLYSTGYFVSSNQAPPEVVKIAGETQEVVEAVIAEPSVLAKTVTVVTVAGLSYLALCIASLVIFFVIVLLISSNK